MNLNLAQNDSFIHVLKYIYTGKLKLKNQEIDRIFDFMSISKTFQLTSLLEEVSLLLNKSLTLENVALIKKKAIQHEQKELRLACEHFIKENSEKLASGS